MSSINPYNPMQCRLCRNVVPNPGLDSLNLGSRLLTTSYPPSTPKVDSDPGSLGLDFLRSLYTTESAYILKDSLMASDSNIKIREIFVNL